MRNLLAQRVRPKDNHIHWHAIHVGRDFGTQLEVLDGLAETTKVVMNPTDDLQEGVQVQVKPVEPKPWQQRRANHFPADELRSKAMFSPLYVCRELCLGIGDMWIELSADFRAKVAWLAP